MKKAANPFRLAASLFAARSVLLLARRQVRAAPMRHLCRHANALAQRGVGVDGFADVHRVCAHLNRQSDLANHVARVRAHHAAAQDIFKAKTTLLCVNKY
jgi:hypothetical protein